MGRTSSGRSQVGSEVSGPRSDRSDRRRSTIDENTSTSTITPTRRSGEDSTVSASSSNRRKSSRRNTEDAQDDYPETPSKRASSYSSNTYAPSQVSSSYVTTAERDGDSVRQERGETSRRERDYGDRSEGYSRTSNGGAYNDYGDDNDDLRSTYSRQESEKSSGSGKRRESKRDSVSSRKSERKESRRDSQRESSRALSEENHNASLPQNQFPGAFPEEHTSPYRPPGLASDYYGDQGESVQYQPGVRPARPSIIQSADQAHLHEPTVEPNPPPEPSSTGQVGAAASYFALDDDVPAKTNTTPRPSSYSTPSRPDKMPPSTPGSFQSRPSMQRPSDYGNGVSTIGAAAAAGAAAGLAADYFAGGSVSQSHQQSSSSQSFQHSTQQSQYAGGSQSQGGYGQPPRPSDGFQNQYVQSSQNAYGSPPKPPRQDSSGPGLGTAAAAGLAAAGAAAYYSHHHNQQTNSQSQSQFHGQYGHTPSGPDPNFVLGQNQSAFPGSQQQRLKHKNRGPIGKFVNWFRDPHGVAQYEAYTEAIGVCKYCFDPHSSPMDAPRQHHYHHGRPSNVNPSGVRTSKVTKTYRHGNGSSSSLSSSDEERRRRKSSMGKKVVAAGLAGAGAAKIGEALYKQKHDFDDTYSVRSGIPQSEMQQRMSTNAARIDAEEQARFNEAMISEKRRSKGSRYEFTEDTRLEHRASTSSRKSRRDSDSERRRVSRIDASVSAPTELSRGQAMSVGVGAGAAAVGVAALASAEAAHRRRSRSRSKSRSRSPTVVKRKKSYYSKRISPRHSYVDLSTKNTGPLGFGGFFSSPSANEKKGKKSKGFFTFRNDSSSSSDADLAFGEGTVKRRNSKKGKSQRNSVGGKNDTAAILGLAAAGAALAAEGDRRSSKGKSKYSTADGRTGRDSIRQRPSASKINLHDKETGTSDMNDGGVWEDASDDDSIDTALAYGGRLSAKTSRESLADQGTSKWAWRWNNGKEKRKPSGSERKQSESFARPGSSGFDQVAAASIGAGIGAAAADAISHGSAPTYQPVNYAYSPSPSNLPPMQYVDPVATTNPMYFDARKPTPTPDPSPHTIVSRSPAPLKQPQPYAANLSNAPAAQSTVLDKMEAEAELTGSPEEISGYDRRRLELDRRSDSPEGNGRERRNASPPPVNPSTTSRNSVMFSLTDEQIEAERRAAEKHERRQRRREEKRRSGDFKPEEPPTASEVESPKTKPRSTSMIERERREAEIQAELEALYAEQARQMKQEKDLEEYRKKHGETGGIGAAIVGAGIGAAATAMLKDREGKKSSESDRSENDRQSRRRSSLKRSSVGRAPSPPKSTTPPRIPSPPTIVQPTPKAASPPRSSSPPKETQQERMARMAARKIARTPSPTVHEDYSTFFVPEELAGSVKDHNEKAEKRDHDVANIVTIGPDDDGNPQLPIFDPFVYRPYGSSSRHDSKKYGWSVPMLELVEPTPPGSRSASKTREGHDDPEPLVSPAKGIPAGAANPKESLESLTDDDLPKVIKSVETSSSTGSKVTWGKHDTYEYEVQSPESERNDPVLDQDDLGKFLPLTGEAGTISTSEPIRKVFTIESDDTVPATRDIPPVEEMTPQQREHISKGKGFSDLPPSERRSKSPPKASSDFRPVFEHREPSPSPEPSPAEEVNLQDLLNGKYRTPFKETVSDLGDLGDYAHREWPKTGQGFIEDQSLPATPAIDTVRSTEAHRDLQHDPPSISVEDVPVENRESRSQRRRLERAMSSSENVTPLVRTPQSERDIVLEHPNEHAVTEEPRDRDTHYEQPQFTNQMPGGFEVFDFLVDDDGQPLPASAAHTYEDAVKSVLSHRSQGSRQSKREPEADHSQQTPPKPSRSSTFDDSRLQREAKFERELPKSTEYTSDPEDWERSSGKKSKRGNEKSSASKSEMGLGSKAAIAAAAAGAVAVTAAAVEPDFYGLEKEKSKDRKKKKRESEIFEDYEAKSTVSTPATKDEDHKSRSRSKRDSGRYDNDDYDDNKSIASTPATKDEDKKSRKKKRDSDVFKDDDDDTKSVTSVSSEKRRSKGKELEKKSSSGGLFSSFFGKGSDVSASTKKSSKSSKSDSKIDRDRDKEDDEKERRRKRRSKDDGQYDDAASMVSEPARTSHRSKVRDVEDSEKTEHQSRDVSVDDSFVSADDGQADQQESFLAERPDMPTPTATVTAMDTVTPMGTDGVSGLTSERPTVTPLVLSAEEDQGNRNGLEQTVARSKDLTPSALLDQEEHALSGPEHDEGTPLQTTTPKMERARRLSAIRTADFQSSPANVQSPTAVPLSFGRRYPVTPSSANQNPTKSSPALATPVSPVQASRKRQSRPKSYDFSSSREFKPLYLVEHHSATKPVAPVEEDLPSLPSSRTSSTHPSTEDLRGRALAQLEGHDDYDISPDRTLPQFRDLGDADQRPASPDYLDSRSATPVPFEKQRARAEELTESPQSYMPTVPPPSLSLEEIKERKAKQREREMKLAFHSPSELLQDPHDNEYVQPQDVDVFPEGERAASPLPSVVSTSQDEEFMSAESGRATPVFRDSGDRHSRSRSRSRSRVQERSPSRGRDAVIAAGFGALAGVAAGAAVGTLLGGKDHDHQPENVDNDEWAMPSKKSKKDKRKKKKETLDLGNSTPSTPVEESKSSSKELLAAEVEPAPAPGIDIEHERVPDQTRAAISEQFGRPPSEAKDVRSTDRLPATSAREFEIAPAPGADVPRDISSGPTIVGEPEDVGGAAADADMQDDEWATSTKKTKKDKKKRKSTGTNDSFTSVAQAEEVEVPHKTFDTTGTDDATAAPAPGVDVPRSVAPVNVESTIDESRGPPIDVEDDWALPSSGKKSKKDKKKRKTLDLTEPALPIENDLGPIEEPSATTSEPNSSAPAERSITGIGAPADEDEWALPSTSKKSKKDKKKKGKGLDFDDVAVGVGAPVAVAVGAAMLASDATKTPYERVIEDSDLPATNMREIQPDEAKTSAIQASGPVSPPEAVDMADDQPQDEADFLELVRTKSFQPSAAQLADPYSDLGAFEQAFERAVLSRGLAEGVTREQALEVFLPKRDNAPFVPKGGLTPVPEGTPATAPTTPSNDKGGLSRKNSSKKEKRKGKKTNSLEVSTPKDSMSSLELLPEEENRERSVDFVEEPEQSMAFERKNPFGNDFEIEPESRGSTDHLKLGQQGDDSIPPDARPDDKTVSVAIAEPSVGQDEAQGQDEIPAEEPEQYNWAPISKKGKKNKRKSQQSSAAVYDDDQFTQPAEESVQVFEPASEPIIDRFVDDAVPPTEEQSRQLETASADAEEFSWAPKGKDKKKEKGKSQISTPVVDVEQSALPDQEATERTADKDIEILPETSNRNISRLTEEPLEPQADSQAVEEQGLWASTSKKDKKKKKKQSQSSTSVQELTEEATQPEETTRELFNKPEAVTGDITYTDVDLSAHIENEIEAEYAAKSGKLDKGQKTQQQLPMEVPSASGPVTSTEEQTRELFNKPSNIDSDPNRGEVDLSHHIEREIEAEYATKSGVRSDAPEQFAPETTRSGIDLSSHIEDEIEAEYNAKSNKKSKKAKKKSTTDWTDAVAPADVITAEEQTRELFDEPKEVARDGDRDDVDLSAHIEQEIENDYAVKSDKKSKKGKKKSTTDWTDAFAPAAVVVGGLAAGSAIAGMLVDTDGKTEVVEEPKDIDLAQRTEERESSRSLGMTEPVEGGTDDFAPSSDKKSKKNKKKKSKSSAFEDWATEPVDEPAVTQIVEDPIPPAVPEESLEISNRELIEPAVPDIAVEPISRNRDVGLQEEVVHDGSSKPSVPVVAEDIVQDKISDKTRSLEDAPDQQSAADEEWSMPAKKSKKDKKKKRQSTLLVSEEPPARGVNEDISSELKDIDQPVANMTVDKQLEEQDAQSYEQRFKESFEKPDTQPAADDDDEWATTVKSKKSKKDKKNKKRQSMNWDEDGAAEEKPSDKVPEIDRDLDTVTIGRSDDAGDIQDATLSKDTQERQLEVDPSTLPETTSSQRSRDSYDASTPSLSTLQPADSSVQNDATITEEAVSKDLDFEPLDESDEEPSRPIPVAQPIDDWTAPNRIVTPRPGMPPAPWDVDTPLNRAFGLAFLGTAKSMATAAAKTKTANSKTKPIPSSFKPYKAEPVEKKVESESYPMTAQAVERSVDESVSAEKRSESATEEASRGEAVSDATKPSLSRDIDVVGVDPVTETSDLYGAEHIIQKGLETETSKSIEDSKLLLEAESTAENVDLSSRAADEARQVDDREVDDTWAEPTKKSKKDKKKRKSSAYPTNELDGTRDSTELQATHFADKSVIMEEPSEMVEQPATASRSIKSETPQQMARPELSWDHGLDKKAKKKKRKTMELQGIEFDEHDQPIYNRMESSELPDTRDVQIEEDQVLSKDVVIDPIMDSDRLEEADQTAIKDVEPEQAWDFGLSKKKKQQKRKAMEAEGIKFDQWDHPVYSQSEPAIDDAVVPELTRELLAETEPMMKDDAAEDDEWGTQARGKKGKKDKKKRKSEVSTLVEGTSTPSEDLGNTTHDFVDAESMLPAERVADGEPAESRLASTDDSPTEHQPDTTREAMVGEEEWALPGSSKKSKKDQKKKRGSTIPEPTETHTAEQESARGLELVDELENMVTSGEASVEPVQKPAGSVGLEEVSALDNDEWAFSAPSKKGKKDKKKRMSTTSTSMETPVEPIEDISRSMDTSQTPLSNAEAVRDVGQDEIVQASSEYYGIQHHNEAAPVHTQEDLLRHIEDEITAAYESVSGPTTSETPATALTITDIVDEPEDNWALPGKKSKKDKKKKQTLDFSLIPEDPRASEDVSRDLDLTQAPETDVTPNEQSQPVTSAPEPASVEPAEQTIVPREEEPREEEIWDVPGKKSKKDKKRRKSTIIPSNDLVTPMEQPTEAAGFTDAHDTIRSLNEDAEPTMEFQKLSSTQEVESESLEQVAQFDQPNVRKLDLDEVSDNIDRDDLRNIQSTNDATDSMDVTPAFGTPAEHAQDFFGPVVVEPEADDWSIPVKMSKKDKKKRKSGLSTPIDQLSAPALEEATESSSKDIELLQPTVDNPTSADITPMITTPADQYRDSMEYMSTQPEEDSWALPGKKNKKDKKKRQSEVLTPVEQLSRDVEVDSKAQYDTSSSHIPAEQDVIEASTVELDPASEQKEPEAAEDTWAFSSKKSKKDKKKRKSGLALSAEDFGSSTTQDVESENASQQLSRDVDANVDQSQDIKPDEQEQPFRHEAIREGPGVIPEQQNIRSEAVKDENDVEDEWSLSRKSSKKDKKKKKKGQVLDLEEPVSTKDTTMQLLSGDATSKDYQDSTTKEVPYQFAGDTEDVKMVDSLDVPTAEGAPVERDIVTSNTQVDHPARDASVVEEPVEATADDEWSYTPSTKSKKDKKKAKGKSAFGNDTSNAANLAAATAAAAVITGVVAAGKHEKRSRAGSQTKISKESQESDSMDVDAEQALIDEYVPKDKTTRAIENAEQEDQVINDYIDSEGSLNQDPWGDAEMSERARDDEMDATVEDFFGESSQTKDNDTSWMRSGRKGKEGRKGSDSLNTASRPPTSAPEQSSSAQPADDKRPEEKNLERYDDILEAISSTVPEDVLVTPAETPAVEKPDDFSWAPTTKKGKKNKKRRSVAWADDDTSTPATPASERIEEDLFEDTRALDDPIITSEQPATKREPEPITEENLAPASTIDTNSSAAIQSDLATPATEKEEFSWEPTPTKKKSKKDKKRRSQSEQSEDFQTSKTGFANDDLEPSQENVVVSQDSSMPAVLMTDSHLEVVDEPSSIVARDEEKIRSMRVDSPPVAEDDAQIAARLAAFEPEEKPTTGASDAAEIAAQRAYAEAETMDVGQDTSSHDRGLPSEGIEDEWAVPTKKSKKDKKKRKSQTEETSRSTETIMAATAATAAIGAIAAASSASRSIDQQRDQQMAGMEDMAETEREIPASYIPLPCEGLDATAGDDWGFSSKKQKKEKKNKRQSIVEEAAASDRASLKNLENLAAQEENFAELRGEDAEMTGTGNKEDQETFGRTVEEIKETGEPANQAEREVALEESIQEGEGEYVSKKSKKDKKKKRGAIMDDIAPSSSIEEAIHPGLSSHDREISMVDSPKDHALVDGKFEEDDLWAQTGTKVKSSKNKKKAQAAYDDFYEQNEEHSKQVDLSEPNAALAVDEHLSRPNDNKPFTSEFGSARSATSHERTVVEGTSNVAETNNFRDAAPEPEQEEWGFTSKASKKDKKKRKSTGVAKESADSFAQSPRQSKDVLDTLSTHGTSDNWDLVTKPVQSTRSERFMQPDDQDRSMSFVDDGSMPMSSGAVAKSQAALSPAHSAKSNEKRETARTSATQIPQRPTQPVLQATSSDLDVKMTDKAQDSDGSNVSESTRERRKRRRSPPLQRDHDPDDLPRSSRDRAMTPPPEHDDLMDTALGVAAGLGFGANQHHQESRPKSDRDERVRDSGIQFDSPTVAHETFETTRDSGYVPSPTIPESWAASKQGSRRPTRPHSPTSSAEDVRAHRRSFHTESTSKPRPMSNLGTQSWDVLETPAKRQPSPVDPTSKDRTSVLFNSSPAGQTPRTPHSDKKVRNEARSLETPTTELHRTPSIHGRKSSSPQPRRMSNELSSSLLNRSAAVEIDRSAFSPSPNHSPERPFSPGKTPLQTIHEGQNGHGNNTLAMGALAAGALGGAALLAASTRDSPTNRPRSLGESKSRTSSLRDLRGSTTSPLNGSEVQPTTSRGLIDDPSAAAKGAARNMADSYEGYGSYPGSPMSPTKPPSVKKRQSMQQIQDLQSRVDQLANENRSLAEAKIMAERHLEEFQLDRNKNDYATDESLKSLNEQLRQRDEEIVKLREQIEALIATHETLKSDHETRFVALQNEHSQAQTQWHESSRELEGLRSQHEELSTGMEDIVRTQIDAALLQKNAEVQRLRQDLEVAREQIRQLQSEILKSRADEIVVVRDEDYFDNACQTLCQHVQQWVLRFSKFSDTRVCFATHEVRDEKVVDRFDNAVLDGSDVDSFLSDRVKRRDIFMSVVMTMIWEYVFTRYLFGMDRDQRQKLKQLEKNLGEVGPPNAVHQWRALTLTLLTKREAFRQQRESDTEAVVLEIMKTLKKFLPPPQNLEGQIYESLRKVIRTAVDLSIEMRTQKAEYIMLPPLQPEYDTNGDLARKVYFNASLMNERSGETSNNDELEANQSVVRIVLFPLVVKKGDDSGKGNEEIVVCPAQVLVAKPDKGKRPKSRLASGGSERMSLDPRASASARSLGAMSGIDMGNVI